MACKRGASGASDDESLSSTGGFILNGQSGVESQEESKPTEKTSSFAGQDSTRNQERYQPEELSFPDFREADIAEEKNQDGSESLPNVQNAGQAPGEEARRGYLSETDLVSVEGEAYNRLGHRIIDPNILGARGLVVDNNNDSADSQASLPQTHISSPVKDRENLSTIHQNNNNVASSSSGNNSTVNPKADLHTSLPQTQASPALPQTQASPTLPQTQASPALPQTQASPAASRRQSARVAGLNPAQHTQATNTIPVRHSLVNFNIKLTGPPPSTRPNLSNICTIPGHAHEPKHRHTTLCADTACGWQITHRHTHTVTTAIAPAPNPPPASNHTSANINQSLPNMPPIPAVTNPEETLAEGHEAQSGVAEMGQEPLENETGRDISHNIDEDLGELECCEGYNREIHPQNHESIRQATHSDVIIACQNTNEHESHGVCETCLAKTWAHLYATHGHLFRDTCWPLCKTCGDRELSQAGNVAPADLDGCTCFVNVLCYNCRIFERETAQWMNKAEASFRRSEPTLVDEAGAAATAEQIQNGENVFMVSGWKCECGAPIGQDVQVVRCAGCNCVKNGTWSDDAAAQKEREFGNTAAY